MQSDADRFVFPTQRPDSSPVFLWHVQQRLLFEAESLLGARDTSKTIYQPVFDTLGPILINTPNLDGAFAKLSMNAAAYWPTTVYELAHETVHLLNPRVGYTNWLEEGVAVAFSAEMATRLTVHPQCPSLPSYLEAWKLVRTLSDGVFDAAKLVRERCGALGLASFESLQLLFPNHSPEMLHKLAENCMPR